MTDNYSTTRRNSLIVELIGLAGAGKTTLAQNLTERDGNVQIAADLELRKTRGARVFFSQVPFLLPEFIGRDGCSRRFTWDEVKSMVYLRAWPHLLRRQAQCDGTVILLDHGPIFKLATLHGFGPQGINCQGAASWWDATVEEWASTLDIAVWLHAPEEVLIERINGRHQRHAVKGKPQLEAREFLMRYQNSYDYILTKLAEHKGPDLLQFDTNSTSVGRIAEEILAACGASPAKPEMNWDNRVE